MSYNCSKVVLGAMICAMVLATTTAQNSPDDFVNAHNAARAAVGVGPVSWDDTVAAYAQDYANQRIGDCQLIHSGGSYGENLYEWSANVDPTAQNAVDYWVSEQQYYDYNSNTCASGHVCLHYTQVVWAASTSIGCARVVCDNDGGVFIICSYNPRGNMNEERPY